MSALPRRIRLWLTRLLALAAIAAAVHGAVDALRQSRTTFRYARRHVHESLAVAQDRLFGAEYMASVRAVRRAFDLNRTVFFVDERHEDGSNYFALFHLAPRRLVRFRRSDEPLRRATRGPGRLARYVVVVPPRGGPLEIVDLRDASPGPKGVREARP